MSILNYVKFLGNYYGEQQFNDLLLGFGISKPPKIDRGDITTYLSAKKIGVEFCFRDEKYINNPQKSFPEGALVVSNIRFYGFGVTGYGSYQGAIFSDVTLKSQKKEIIELIGLPNAPKFSETGEPLPGENASVFRWDRSDHCLFFAFSKDGAIRNVAIQLPLDQT